MKIAVYCGSTLGNNPRIVEKVKELGKWMGENGHTLIYGGGDAGLMGTIAKEVHAYQNPVIGVLPGNVSFICSRPQPYCSEVIIAKNMNERKQVMLEKADAFIALPGGIGTLDEISEAITLTKIGVFSKPSICFNVDGFYTPFQHMLEEMSQTDFLNGKEMTHVLFSENISCIESFLKESK